MPPKLLVTPRMLEQGLSHDGCRGQQADEAALGEEHDEHEERAQDDLPVHRPRGQHVLEQEEDQRADERPTGHAAQDHHQHDLARARPVHELRCRYWVWLTSSAPATPHGPES